MRDAGHGRHPNDVGAMAMQCSMSKRQDFLAKVIGEFAFANQQERNSYIDVYKRGLLEVTKLLKRHAII